MTIETLRKAKKDTISTLMRFGKSHPVLKYPVFITTVIFIFVYNVFLHTLIQIHIHEKLARVMAAVLSVAVFFTGMDLTVLAVQSAVKQEETYTVTEFAALSEEVADQRVPVGTTVEELNLPDVLVAYTVQNRGDSDDNADKPGGKEDTVSGNEGGGEDDTVSGNEGDSDAGTGDGSGEGGSDAGTGDGSVEGGSDAGTGDGSGESSDAGTGEGSGESGDTGTGEGSGEGGDTGTGDGSGESGDVGIDEGGDSNGDAGSDEGSSDGGNGDAGSDEGSSDGGNGDAGSDEGSSDGGNGDAGSDEGGSDGGNGDAGSDEGGSDGGNGDAGLDEAGSVKEAAGALSESVEGNGESTPSGAADDIAYNTAAEWQIHTAEFVLPVYFSENTEKWVAETLTDGGDAEETAPDNPDYNGNAEEPGPEDNGSLTEAEPKSDEPADENIREEIVIEGITWQSSPAYDGNTEGTYVFTPVLPDGYVLAESVSLPQITVTVEKDISPAWKLLKQLLADYFAGEEEGLYQAVLSMEKDTRLAMMAAYEDVTAALTEEDAEDERLNAILTDIREGFREAGQQEKYGPVMYEIIGAQPAAAAPMKMRKAARAAGSSLTAGPISLRKLGGEGSGFYYTAFEETKQFVPGATYAFLDDLYDYEDAVASLGSGAVLEVTSDENSSVKYAGNDCYADMQFTHSAYVNVITPGEDFDACKKGGIFKVGSNSGTPQEYRYFCGYSGAQNCGPLYAYTYKQKELNYTHVDAFLKNIARQGSNFSWDYTVTLTIKDEVTTVSSSSYRVSADQSTGVVTITVKDSEGNEIITRFQGPIGVRYQGNDTGVTGVPEMQGLWPNDNVTLSTQKPARSGYQFEGWRYNSANASTIHQPGAKLTAVSRSVNLYAAWRDIQKPVVSVKPFQVMVKTSDADIREEIKSRLTITDNEPVSECRTVIEGSDYAARPGVKNITVKVTDKAGNVGTAIAVVTVAAKPLEFAAPAFDADTKALTAVLKEAGTETITETGFVWGIMTNPSLTLYNGKAKTAQPVTDSNGRVWVTAQNLQKGVTYYARTYAVTGTGADKITYYSDQITIGLGLPAYGTFTIANNGNNIFTVSRTGGSEGVQQVYFRTVNGSAVGGTHFSHQANILTFAAGETLKTITVTEAGEGANRAYKDKPTTAYTNADRTYSVQIYRVTGGGTLGSTTSAVRTMGKGSGYTISRDVYDKEKERSVSTDNDNKYVVDRKKSQDDQVVFSNDRGYNLSHPDGETNCHKNFNVQRKVPDYGENTNAYLKATADGYYYRLRFTAAEKEDAWAHIWIANHKPNQFNSANRYSGPVSLNDSLVGPSKFTARWDITGGTAALTFPGNSERSNITSYGENVGSGAVEGNYLVFGLEEEANVWFAANGKNEDIWYVETYKDWIKVRDVKEPQLVGVAPMADGIYKAGDQFVVSLVFDEIVDSVNSTNIGRVSVNTNWGLATYAGGADTNVLYFTGTVKGDASGSLQVTSIANPEYIKDMCDANTKTSTASGTGSTGAQVDTSVPAFNVVSAGIANGVGTVKVTVTPDQSKTTSMRYAWSDTATMPVNGWVDMTAAELQTAKSANGFSSSIRKEAGSGSSNGKWYLHVIGAYETTGATTYQYATLDFGTKSNPAAGSTAPELTVSVNNSQWATQRTISIQQKGASSLKYRNAGVVGSSWQSLSTGATSVKVTENGYYTFLLTAGDMTIAKSVTVEKIDRADPTASVGLPTEAGTIESPKQGTYTKLTLPVTYGDEHSGVKTVQYAWTNSSSAPGSWNTLSGISTGGGSTSLAYVSTEAAPTMKYLHIRVTDQLGHTCETTSAAYQMISQGTVDSHTPGITLSGAPTKWTNDMATLQWSLTNYAGKNYEVILPDGRNAKSGTNSGQVWARSNGTYTVKVKDLDYGGENTATVEVTKIDTTAPAVTPSAVSEDWKKSAQTVTFSASDSQSGVGKKYYKIVDTDDKIPADGLTQLTSNSVSVTKDGAWYVYYKYYDQAGDDSTGREANKTEGFVGPIKIDSVTPTAAVSMGGSKNEQTGWYTAAVPATLTFTDPQSAVSGSGAPGGVSSVQYQWVNTKTKPTSGLTALTASQIQAGSHVATQAGDGTWYLYYQVTDAAGNMTDGFSEEAVKIDKTEAALTVSGPAVSAEKRTGFTLSAQTGSFGVSGGALSVKKAGQEAETALKNSAGSGALSAGYSITEPGTYHFYSRTNADKSDGATAVQTRYVRQVTFDSRGGSAVEPQLVWTSHADAAGNTSGTVECKVQKPADPEKRGLVFGGWYTDEKCKIAFEFNSQIYEDTTLYAKWTADAYEVTYHLTNPDGSAYQASDRYQTYTFGEGLTLPVPELDGYQFGGWYLTADYTGDVQKAIGEDETGARAYYACYVDITAPQIAAELSAQSRESGWYTERPDIILTYSDNQGVKQLFVSVDEEEWQELSGFPVGDAIKDDTEYTWVFAALLQGEHTYAFRAVDAIGLSKETDPIRVKLDTVKPVIGELTYENRTTNLWQWIIGKKSMVIHVPVTDAGSNENAGSGVKKISYTMTHQAADGTPDADRAKTRTAAIKDGEAKITFDEDFRGDIAIACTDVAGNDADIVTVGVSGSGGVIVEDTPPVVMFRTPAANEDGWYKESLDVTVEVADDRQENEAITSGGIARIAWKEGEGGAEQIIEGLPGDSPVYKKEFSIPVDADGIHTYYVKAVDNAGNRSAGNAGEWENVTVQLDTVKPVIGEITYNEGYVNLWHWLIRRDSLIVNIPVTEEMSGLGQVTYTLTPGSMQNAQPVTKEAKIEKTTADAGAQYTATIVIDPDYKGVIGDIQATDIAGNVSESVTAYANGIGVIVEELKPVITVTADRLPTEEQAGTKTEGEELSADYYQTAPELFVKVQDGSMSASGIKEVKWKIGSGSENTEDGGFGDALKTEYGFRIALDGLTGTVQTEISAVDNAGNSESQTVTVKIKGKEQTPEAETDYPVEKLTGLKPGETYLVRLPGGKTVSRKADDNGEISIDNGWFGKEISLIKKGDGKNTKNSDPQSIALAARPAAPVLQKNDETIKGKKDGQVTGVTDVMEISRDGKKIWEKAEGTVTDAASGKFWARVAATQTAPRGEEASVTIGEGRSLTVTFDSQGGSKVKPIKGLSWKEAVKKPTEPKKEGDNGFCGWYREVAYENKWHFAQEPEADLMTDDVTLFAKWLPKTDAPMTVGISYRDETLTKLEPGKVYLIEGKEVTASAEGTVPIDESWFGKKINIVRRGDGTNTGDSDALLLTVPNRPAGPTKVQVRNESAEGARDGKLTKTDTTMQYRRKGSTEWIDITGDEITNLEPGDYELRYVSTDTAFSSKIVVKTVKKYSPPKKDDGDNGGKTPGGETKPGDGTEPDSDTKPEEGTKPGGGTRPEDGTTPGDGTEPEDEIKPDDDTKLEDGTKPGDDMKLGDGTKPGDGTEPEDGTKPGDGTEPGDGTKPGDDTKLGDSTTPRTGTAPGHVVEDGRIVLEDSADGASGNTEQSTDGNGSLTGDHPYAVGKIVETLTIPVNQGAVIVTVNNMDKTLCTAQAADAVAVANAVLSQEHISRVSKGETVEIRIDVERIDDRVSSQDKDLIEQGIEKAQKEAPGLTVGMYVDISMFLRTGEGEWSAVHEIDEPIEIMIDMPEELQEFTADFYIVRVHAGEFTLLPDLDDAAETITIKTERFSTYAIAYRLTDVKEGRCGLCHICPTFMGICCFIWLILIAAGLVVIIILWHRKKDNTEEKVM